VPALTLFRSCFTMMSIYMIIKSSAAEDRPRRWNEERRVGAFCARNSAASYVGLLDALGRSIVIGHYDKRVSQPKRSLPNRLGKPFGHARGGQDAVRQGAAERAARRAPLSSPPSWNLFDTEYCVGCWNASSRLSSCGTSISFASPLTRRGGAGGTHANPAQLAAISDGVANASAESGHDNTLDADISFHVAVLRASNNPFFLQFREVVSMGAPQFHPIQNRIKGRLRASPIMRSQGRDCSSSCRRPESRCSASSTDVLELIEKAERRSVLAPLRIS